MSKKELPQELEIESTKPLAERLDLFLVQELQSQYVDYPSRSKISRWIKSGSVRVDDRVVLQPSFKIGLGDTVSLSIPSAADGFLEARNEELLDICFEDECIIVLNKPPGLSMHPGAGQNDKTTLAHLLVGYLGNSIRQIGHPIRPGIVHRLDKDTSGLVVVAKTIRAFQQLSEQFLPPRTIHREYLALTERLPFRAGSAKESSGTIDAAIARHPTNRKVMHVVEKGGKPAVSHWSIEEELVHGYCVKMILETGRTHQIRAHLKSVNTPIVGDKVYGYRTHVKHMDVKLALQQVNRQMLHAFKLRFLHPLHNEELSLEAPPPQDFADAKRLLNGEME